jgi:hypothetical protein
MAVKKGEPLENGTPIQSATWMSINARGGLKDANFEFLEEVVPFSDDELLAIPRVGPRAVERLRRWQRGEPQDPPDTPGARDDDDREFIAYAAHRAAGQAPEAAKRRAVKVVEEFDRLKGGGRG